MENEKFLYLDGVVIIRITIFKSVVATLVILLFATSASAKSTEDLAKGSQNPVGNIISLPIEYWHYGGISKLARFGKQPVDFKLQVFGNVEKPEGGPEWSLQFAVKFLFPK